MIYEYIFLDSNKNLLKKIKCLKKIIAYTNDCVSLNIRLDDSNYLLGRSSNFYYTLSSIFLGSFYFLYIALNFEDKKFELKAFILTTLTAILSHYRSTKFLVQ